MSELIMEIRPAAVIAAEIATPVTDEQRVYELPEKQSEILNSPVTYRYNLCMCISVSRFYLQNHGKSKNKLIMIFFINHQLTILSRKSTRGICTCITTVLMCYFIRIFIFV